MGKLDTVTVNGPEGAVVDWDAVQGPGVVPFWCEMTGSG
jgi:hypothetical protein